jgi:hypothetical protein
MEISMVQLLTPLECLDASLHDFHRDYPRRVVRSLAWCEDHQRRLRDVCDVKTAATRRLRIYNGSGVIFAMGNLDYMLDVVRTETRCYTLLI